MPATVQLRSYHGSTPDSGTDIASSAVRFKAADNDTVNALTPLVVPTSGTTYSYVKHLRLHATVTPANLLSNTQFYSDGANGFGTGVSLNVKTSSSYTDPIAQAQTVLSGTADAHGYVAASPLSVSGSLANPSTGAYGDYIQLQMAVASTASQGPSGSETFTVTYDES